MHRKGLTSRPQLKDIVDVVIEEVQGARLREEPLLLDRYAQTELVNGRAEISVNTRIAEMPGVKDVAGIVLVAKWHESIHVVRDFVSVGQSLATEQLPFLGLNAELPTLIACRGYGEQLSGTDRAREFFAEAAGIAAAVCFEDLRHCPAFGQLLNRARRGDELGGAGWSLLYESASFIGVNATAFANYLQQRGLIRIDRSGGSSRLFGNPQLLEEIGWLKAN